ncbi:ABC transporter ATP-binding protein [Hoeflea prorocentri]|uniref:ABC transporter ATP-binding protein n=1 Tax=Hoeflea prorocentri TaxID=1922333 RepID=A0A9X3ZFN1_9HYPH|nr:ABC transporter ATP-binding protein [Hoeflea prorocentri]MCY6379872.1 ABC transporter ATP-binding protein [Hoeflea prorocentri]MDA5397672.1 ABC transporter ATP-binding protein [Hoeflea prorocentri]
MSVVIRSALKTFADHAAVNKVSAEIPDGEFFVILGPSGCGKSTLLRLIAGLETLDDGEILIDGKTVSGPQTHISPEDRKIGMVFQSYALWPHMNVRQNVSFPVTASGGNAKTAASIADAQIKAVSLEGLEGRKPSELSGGQRQRVALARCLAGQSRIILMDEPLANLDPHLRNAMEEELATFHRMAGATTLFITHDQREGMALASHIAVMDDGRFLQVGTPEEIYNRPATEKVARFVGRSGIVAATTDPDGHVMIGGKPVDTGASARGSRNMHRAVIRPSDIAIGDDGRDARVTTVAYRGGSWDARVAIEGLEDTLPVTVQKRLEIGETLPVTVNSAWLLPDNL